jgi:hypothetical protein
MVPKCSPTVQDTKLSTSARQQICTSSPDREQASK